MKQLRILLAGGVLAVAALVGACESRDPVTPPAAPRYDGSGTSIPCDSACQAERNPGLGSGGG
ncbi:MAG TPA: hypothetical protein VGR37_23470 [Longimicrobiaceae bacterium]|nr:hypothetical protein [Longimicrobiaceae bacterium]